jgi:hypothetical protein
MKFFQNHAQRERKVASERAKRMLISLFSRIVGGYLKLCVVRLP